MARKMSNAEVRSRQQQRLALRQIERNLADDARRTQIVVGTNRT
jgi:hypothetical protein